MPVNKNRELLVTLDKPQPGHNGLNIYLVAYKWFAHNFDIKIIRIFNNFFYQIKEIL